MSSPINSASSSPVPIDDASNAQTFQLQPNESTRAAAGKHSARYSCRSLQDTNIRPDYSYFEESSPLQEETSRREEEKENKEMDCPSSEGKEVETLEERRCSKDEKRQDFCWKERLLAQSGTQLDDVSSSDKGAEEQLPMCRKKVEFYLAQRQLIEKIEDLAERELHASTRQKWAEALRLRDMRNRLELMLEKKLYDTKVLHMDEEARELALKYIERRQNELAERDSACTDCTVYSDEAKVLWKKWVQEDDRSMIKEARLRRETLMKDLEQEFENLTTRDKAGLDTMYHDAIHDSYLHHRRHLTASNTEAEISSYGSS